VLESELRAYRPRGRDRVRRQHHDRRRDIDWFFNPLYGDVHLSIVVPISVASAATWSQGDPLADFDGDPRPATEGSVDFVGADRVP
jgi:hypothetical protein